MLDCAAHDPSMVIQQRRVFATGAFQQRCRAFDVGEQQGPRRHRHLLTVGENQWTRGRSGPNVWPSRMPLDGLSATRTWRSPRPPPPPTTRVTMILRVVLCAHRACAAGILSRRERERRDKGLGYSGMITT